MNKVFSEILLALDEEFPATPVPPFRTAKLGADLRWCAKRLGNRRWNDIRPEEYVSAGECPLYLDVRLMAYYMPGFLSAVLKTWPGSLDGVLFLCLHGRLLHPSEDSPLVAALTPGQRRCVLMYLEFVSEHYASVGAFEASEQCREALSTWGFSSP